VVLGVNNQRNPLQLGSQFKLHAYHLFFPCDDPEKLGVKLVTTS